MNSFYNIVGNCIRIGGDMLDLSKVVTIWSFEREGSLVIKYFFDGIDNCFDSEIDISDDVSIEMTKLMLDELFNVWAKARNVKTANPA